MAARFNDDLAKLIERLDHLGSIRPGLLGGEGTAIDADILGRARALLEQMLNLDVPRPRIFPTPGGGVQMEWTSKPIEIS